MKFKRNVEIVKGRPDLTALVNVILLLVFFFLVSSVFVQQPGIKIDYAQSKVIGTLPFKSLVVMITAPDEVFFQDTKLTLAEFRQRLAEEAKKSGDQQLVIKADRRVPHGTVIEVMDMAFHCNLRAVNLATRPELSAPPAQGASR
jgi:biopolymer transport protein ExbD